ncbi:hypothetical protein FCIRC_12206 [Fusarium circinatum]|uniref:Uncharacterized protein n=1 Tax=Fusarium circinatum TaxID=48490 RepID=A0A8H5WJB8_FUSCI|nr:hypothetical protein FCIRC_12206 [Fusarium circinatum]
MEKTWDETCEAMRKRGQAIVKRSVDMKKEIDALEETPDLDSWRKRVEELQKDSDIWQEGMKRLEQVEALKHAIVDLRKKYEALEKEKQGLEQYLAQSDLIEMRRKNDHLEEPIEVLPSGLYELMIAILAPPTGTRHEPERDDACIDFQGARSAPDLVPDPEPLRGDVGDDGRSAQLLHHAHRKLLCAAAIFGDVIVVLIGKHCSRVIWEQIYQRGCLSRSPTASIFAARESERKWRQSNVEQHPSYLCFQYIAPTVVELDTITGRFQIYRVAQAKAQREAALQAARQAAREQAEIAELNRPEELKDLLKHKKPRYGCGGLGY